MKAKYRTSLDGDLYHLHPRLLLSLQLGQSLNSPWNFGFVVVSSYRQPADILRWNHVIEVPLAPETERSRIGDSRFQSVCCLQRECQMPLHQLTVYSLLIEHPRSASKLWP